MGFGGSFADPEDGRISTEQDAPDPESIASFRVPGEQACLAFADEGVRSSVVRVAPTVRDANRWPAIHRLDAASLFRLALEKAPSGSALHGAGESAITRKSIAEHIAWILQIPTAFLTLEQAADHLVDPFLARAFVTDAPASSTRTQTLLGWTPTHATLLEDMETGDYFAQQTARPRSAPHRDHSQS